MFILDVVKEEPMPTLALTSNTNAMLKGRPPGIVGSGSKEAAIHSAKAEEGAGVDDAAVVPGGGVPGGGGVAVRKGVAAPLSSPQVVL